jgi:DNA-binding CsgD family transcriptional regulator/pimeloyl-ACP methyl ester carboxylesterase
LSGRAAYGQRLRFFEHRGRRVAFATFGSGPPLLCDLGSIQHLDVFWRYPPYRRLIEALAREFTVIRFDRPGCGLSERSGADFTMDGELALFDGLAEHLRLDQVAVLASGSSVPAVVTVAALHPERTSRLALFGAHERPWHEARDFRVALDALLRTRFTLATDVLARRVATGCDAVAAAWLSAAYRQAASGEVIAQWLRESATVDVRALVGRIRCPTLLMHRRGDRLVDFQQARDVAARIRDSILLPLDGTESVVWEGDVESLLGPLLRFLTSSGQEASGPDATVLTPREHEIAELVGDGLTNTEIGERLGIGHRTVESHLERIRAKLGLVSRTDLAAWTARSRLDRR